MNKPLYSMTKEELGFLKDGYIKLINDIEKELARRTTDQPRYGYRINGGFITYPTIQEAIDSIVLDYPDADKEELYYRIETIFI